MLSLHDVSKSFSGAKPRQLFHGLNLHLQRGEIVAIMGESGVGKSTFLNLVAGLDRPDGGRIVMDGADLTSMNDRQATLFRREKIGFVFQAFHLLPYLDLARNVALPMRLLGHSVADSVRRATELLTQVGIAAERATDSPATLSGGEMQRVAIARALCHRPPLLLADEPTGNLDAEAAARVLDVLEVQARAAQVALLLVTHSHLAAKRADRVLLLTGTGLVLA